MQVFVVNETRIVYKEGKAGLAVEIIIKASSKVTMQYGRKQKY